MINIYSYYAEVRYLVCKLERDEKGDLFWFQIDSFHIHDKAEMIQKYPNCIHLQELEARKVPYGFTYSRLYEEGDLDVKDS